MKKPIGAALFIVLLGSAFTITEPLPPCDQDIVLSSNVVAQTQTIQVSRLIISAQTFSGNANMTYKSGSGADLYSPFQVFSGSTLTIEIENCPNP